MRRSRLARGTARVRCKGAGVQAEHAFLPSGVGLFGRSWPRSRAHAAIDRRPPRSWGLNAAGTYFRAGVDECVRSSLQSKIIFEIAVTYTFFPVAII